MYYGHACLEQPQLCSVIITSRSFLDFSGFVFVNTEGSSSSSVVSNNVSFFTLSSPLPHLSVSYLTKEWQRCWSYTSSSCATSSYCTSYKWWGRCKPSAWSWWRYLHNSYNDLSSFHIFTAPADHVPTHNIDRGDLDSTLLPNFAPNINSNEDERPERVDSPLGSLGSQDPTPTESVYPSMSHPLAHDSQTIPSFVDENESGNLSPKPRLPTHNIDRGDLDSTLLPNFAPNINSNEDERPERVDSPLGSLGSQDPTPTESVYPSMSHPLETLPVLFKLSLSFCRCFSKLSPTLLLKLWSDTAQRQ